MRVANADSDWDIHCFYLPRDPAVRPAASLFTGVAAMACEWGRDALDDEPTTTPPQAAWCGVGERHNFEKQVYGPRRRGAPADEPDVELGFHDALRVARLVAKGDQMTLEILLSRPVYAIAEENVASMAWKRRWRRGGRIRSSVASMALRDRRRWRESQARRSAPRLRVDDVERGR